MLSYLQLAADPFDDWALREVANTPPRGLGPRTLDRLGAGDTALLLGLQRAGVGTDLTSSQQAACAGLLTLVDDIAAAARGCELPRLFDHILERSGYLAWLRQGRWGSEAEDLRDLLSDDPAEDSLAELRRMAAAQAGLDLHEFLDSVNAQADELALPEDAVQVATLHAVKGLEFPVVFLAGLEEGLFPRANGDRQKLREEYQLFYMGVTRSRALLHLSYARRREINGRLQRTRPSRFLRCLPGHLLEHL